MKCWPSIAGRLRGRFAILFSLLLRIPMAWNDQDLCTDADLTAQESVMPDLAKRNRKSTNATSYDGKRALVKRDIASWLRRNNYFTDALADPTEFNRAAVFLELAYIYADMGSSGDSIATAKAASYREMYEYELEGLQISYDRSVSVPDEKEPVQIGWFRA
jgi:hypothetical protein